MTTIEVTLPKDIKECTPSQLCKWLILTDNQELETIAQHLDFKVQVVSIFSDLRKEEVELFSLDHVNGMFEHIIDMLLFEANEPTGEVNVNGKRYVFPKHFKHFSTGRIIDAKLIEDPLQTPYEMLAILYVEDGMLYNQLNEQKVVVNPLEDRAKEFEKYGFPGDEFLNVLAFFLNHFEKRRDAILALNTARTQITIIQTMEEMKTDINKMSGTTGQATS